MQITTLRRAGLAAVAGGVLTAVAGLVVTAIVTPNSDVSDQVWSYPWSSSALVLVSLVYAVLHALVFAGILGFARSGIGGRVGPALALAGTAVLFAAELMSIVVADQRMDDTVPGLIGACFGLGTLLSAVGFLVAGVVTVRGGRWDGWRRFVPLANGIWQTILIGFAFTSAVAAALIVYGLLVAALGIALRSRPVPAQRRPHSTAVQV